MRALEGYPAWAQDDDLGCGHCLTGMAMAYDWLYDALSPAERRAAETVMLRHGRNMLIRSHPEKPRTFWGWSYFQNHAWVDYNGVTFTAMALHDLQPGEMGQWLNFTRSRFQPTYRNLGLDGGNYEGPAYEHYGTQQLLLYVDALHAFSGESLYDMPYFRRIGYFALYNLMPDWKSAANFGDSGEDGRGRIDDENATKLAAMQRDGHFLTYLEKERAAAGDGEALTAWDLIWADPTVAPKPLDDVPLVGLFPDLGLVTFRTGWDEDAAVLAFHCGPPGGSHLMSNWASFPGANNDFGHVHPDANSFLFWADRQWRISAPGAYTHRKETHNENVWLVGGKGQRGEAKWFDAKTYVNRPDQAHLVIVATSARADYVVGEAAPAYQPRCGLTSFRRHLVFVKAAKPYVVVYDRLTAASPQSWDCYLHANDAFTIGDEGASFRMGGKIAFGAVFGPGGLQATTHPLTVVEHPDDKRVDRGFELVLHPPDGAASTWLVSVIGIEPAKVALVSSDPAPTVKVGGDTIAWDTRDGVTFNGEAIDHNLLP
jgi:hypothetical protein